MPASTAATLALILASQQAHEAHARAAERAAACAQAAAAHLDPATLATLCPPDVLTPAPLWLLLFFGGIVGFCILACLYIVGCLAVEEFRDWRARRRWRS